MRLDRSNRWTRGVAAAAGVLGGLSLTLVAACDSARTPTEPAASAAVPDAEPAFVAGAPEVNAALAAIRAATARFQRFDVATQAGWDTPLTDCFDDPAGGMGFHYGNVGLIDDELEVAQPEALLYEPEPNGRMRLVAVEYIVPFALSEDPPELMGQTFSPNTAFGIWTLHAWVWKENPSGMFAPWNPRVTCP